VEDALLARDTASARADSVLGVGFVPGESTAETYSLFVEVELGDDELLSGNSSFI
jgi:hypothetical protein